MMNSIQQAIADLERDRGHIDAAIKALKYLQGQPATIEKPVRKQKRQAHKAKSRRAQNARSGEPGPEPEARHVMTAPGSGPARSEIAVARDKPVLSALGEHGTVPNDTFIKFLTKEAEQTAEQRLTALRNSLRQLRMKGEIESAEHGAWKLRKRA